MILKSRLTNSQPQVYTGVAHLRGQERRRTGSGDSHTPWVGLERQLPPTSGPGGGRGAAGKIPGNNRVPKTPHRRTARATARSPLSGGGGPRRDAGPASERAPCSGNKVEKLEGKKFPEEAPRRSLRFPSVGLRPPRPRLLREAGPARRSPGRRPPRAGAVSRDPRPEETLGTAGAPRAPRGKVRRVTCGERGERGTTPEAPSRRPPLCLPPVRLPGGNGPPCAPAPGPPRAAPACPSRHLPPRALPGASRGLHAARPGLALSGVGGNGSPATPGRDPQKAFSYGLGARRAGPPTGRRGGDSGNSPRPGKAGGGQVSHGSQLR